MRRRDVIGAGCSALAIALAGCVNDPEAMEGDDDGDSYVRERDREDNESSGTLEDGDLTISDHDFVENDDNSLPPCVHGLVQNDGDAAGDRVMVHAEFLNDAGEVVGTRSDGVGSLDPGEAEPFELCLPSDLERDEFTDYTLSAEDAE